MVTPATILSKLPPYLDEWELVKKHQYVPDIMQEIVTAHVLFAPYYDCFSYLFNRRTASEVAESIAEYLATYVHYKAESVDDQTSALPTGFIQAATGDCKHYALFAAGVIDSLNRIYDRGFEWCYLFAGYRGASEPYHVFVALVDDSEDMELWIDPAPGSGDEPTLLIEQKV